MDCLAALYALIKGRKMFHFSFKWLQFFRQMAIQLQLQALSKLHQARTLNGHLINRLNQQAAAMPRHLPGNYVETIVHNILIVWYPWLCHRNPLIDWFSRKIKELSKTSQSALLTSYVSQTLS